MRTFLLLLMLFLGLVTAPALTHAADQTITLQEHLDRTWQNQLLAISLTSTKDNPLHDCDRILVQGPKGPIAAQLSDRQIDPDNLENLPAATIHFITDLAPLATDTYKVIFNPASVPETDLKINRDFFEITFQTSKFGIKIPNVTSPAPFGASPIDPEKPHPGPLSIWTPQTGWTPYAQFFGNAKPVSYHSYITAHGPVFAQGQITYTFADKTTLTLDIRLTAGDSSALITETVENGDLPASGWLLNLPKLQTLTLFNKGRAALGGIAPGKTSTLEITAQAPGTIVSLQPWQDWWFHQYAVAWTMGDKANPNLINIRCENPGDWAAPAPPGQFGSAELWERKVIPLTRLPDGALQLRCKAASGKRVWRIGSGDLAIGTRLDAINKYTLAWQSPQGAQHIHPHLYLTRDDLAAYAKENKLITPAGLAPMIAQASQFRGEPHPFSDSAAVVAFLLSGQNKDVATQTRLVDRIETPLNIIARADLPPYAHKITFEGKSVDLFRDPEGLTALYDVVMGSDLLTPAQRTRFRARMAYLAYLLNDPAVWSASRGYCSGNLNMSVGYSINRGLLACTLHDHPSSFAWLGGLPKDGQIILPDMETFLNKVGPDGEFPESVSNYLHVTATPMFAFAAALRQAAFKSPPPESLPFHDYVADPRMVRLMRYAAEQFTPPDPRLRNASVRPASGRGNALHTEGLAGLVARATRNSDPALSQEMQWHWLRTGPAYNFTHSPLSGLERFYLDPKLPARQPSLPSKLYRDTGTILRHAVGTSGEFFVNLLMIASDKYVDWYASESGGFPAIYARGVPISVRFGEGYAAREELLISRVLPARGSTDAERKAAFYHDADPAHDGHGRVTAFSTLALQDYASLTTIIGAPVAVPAGLKTFSLPQWPDPIAKPAPKTPIHWQRQLLFIKSPTPEGPSYFLLHDTIADDQPTMWQFWTLSRQIIPLGSKPPENAPPPNTPQDARPLPGDSFTALGQFNVDTDFFVASPQNASPHTLRWGLTHPGVGNLPEYQDMLHLQMPGKGTYSVVVFPRDKNTKPPTFQRLANGAIIKVSGTFGTDYLHASNPKQPATDNTNNIHLTFDSAAASIQERNGQTSLSLAAPGSITFKGISLQSPCPATLTLSDTSITLATPHDQPNQTITYTLPNHQPKTITTTQSQTILPRQ
jgi:hypothetical protein